MIERRAAEGRFATQKLLTFVLIALFALMMVYVFWFSGDKSLVNVVVQAVILFASTAVGYWIGAAKMDAPPAPAIPPPPDPSTTKGPTV